jgi:pimeloyl-ACP methyl ester carboxylesterase
MTPMWKCLATLLGGLLMTQAAGAGTERTRALLRDDEVAIDLIAEGSGPLIVLLPSRGRDSEDYDEVAAGIAKAGFRVLRPQPRGVLRSTGPMQGITLHDLARDVAFVIEHERAGPAVIVGHAFGHFVAKMTAVDHPQLVRGVVLAAAAAKSYPAALSALVSKAGDPALPEAERLQVMQKLFFAPGHDPAVWLHGWFPEANASQRAATLATRQSEWWAAGTVPLLDLQAEHDPFKPRETMNELKEEFGDRVTVVVIPDASHALIPEQPAAVTDAIVAWVRELP